MIGPLRKMFQKTKKQSRSWEWDQSGPDRTGPDQSGFEPNRSELIFCYNTLGLYITDNNQESQVEGKTKRVSFFLSPLPLTFPNTCLHLLCLVLFVLGYGWKRLDFDKTQDPRPRIRTKTQVQDPRPRPRPKTKTQDLPVRFGPDRIASDRTDLNQFGSVRSGLVRSGSVRFGSDRSLLCTTYHIPHIVDM